MVLLVLISSKGQFLNAAFRFPQVLGNISISSALRVQVRFQLTDASLHLNHCLPASLQGIDLGLISPGSSVLALSLQQFLVLLQHHGQVLLSTELISQAGSINHGASSLVPSLQGIDLG